MYSGQIVLEIDAAAAARQVKSLPLQVWRVLRLFDGHRTLLQAIDDSPLEREITLDVVRRLTELGLVHETEHRRPAGPARLTLSDSTRAWIAARRREADTAREVQPEPLAESELESELDALLSDLGADSSSDDHPSSDKNPAHLDAIPEAREHPLSGALQLCIRTPELPAGDLIETLELAEKVRRRLEKVHEISDLDRGPMMLLDTPDIGFTNLELEFFDSYAPELPDDDDFMDLLDEASERHG